MRDARAALLIFAVATAGCSQAVTAPKAGSGTTSSGSGTSSGSTTGGSTSGTSTSSGTSGTTGGGPCSHTSDCTGTQVCIAGLCGDPGTTPLGGNCTATRDCASGLYCSPVGQCAPAGAGAADSSCTADGDCQAGLRCVYDGFHGACGSAGAGEAGSPCSAQTDCLAGLFCSSGSSGAPRTCESFGAAFPPYPGPSCASDDGGLRVYFEVPRSGAYPSDFFRLPYPNDIRVHTTDGGPQLDLSDFPTPGVGIADVDLVALYRDALVADFNGFSPIAPVTFRLSGSIDLNTLGSVVKFVDLTDPTSTSAFYLRYTYVINGNKYNCPNRLTVAPGENTPLRQGHTYAVLLKSGLADSAGNPVRADADLLTVLASTRPSDPDLGHAWDAYAPLRTWLAANGGSSSIVGAAVFTVGTPQSEMAQVAQAVASEPALAISDVAVCGTGQTSSCDALGPDHACATGTNDFYEIHGRMSLPIYQSGTAPYLMPDAGGGIVYAGGAAVKQGDASVCFALTIPKATPAGPWPLVITHHGTGGSMTDFIRSGVAEKLATEAAPLAVLGFDAVEHADRRGGSTQDPEDLVFNVLNPRAARDNFLQGAADILSEAKFANASLDLDAGPGPVSFDPGHVIFFGHSQGATSGELALPFLDAAPAAVLSGASAHLTQSLLHKSSPLDVKAGIALLIQEDPSQLDTEHPVLGLFQNFFDPSDPINANQAIVHAPLTGHVAHDVLMTWGTRDTYTPPETLQANAVSLGIPLAGGPDGGLEGDLGTPISRPVNKNLNVGGGVKVTAAVVQYDTPDGGDGHFDAFTVPAAVDDWSAFIESDLSSAHPTLP